MNASPETPRPLADMAAKVMAATLGPPTTVTVPAELWAEAIESLGGFGLCSPGDLLTKHVIGEAADLARRMEEVA